MSSSYQPNRSLSRELKESKVSKVIETSKLIQSKQMWRNLSRDQLNNDFFSLVGTVADVATSVVNPVGAMANATIGNSKSKNSHY